MKPRRKGACLRRVPMIHLLRRISLKGEILQIRLLHLLADPRRGADRGANRWC